MSEGNGAPPAHQATREDARWATFCRIDETEWRRVVAYDKDGVSALEEPLTFEALWTVPVDQSDERPADAPRISWEDLLVPLPDVAVPCLGYAMTYPSHQVEVRMEDSFFFVKKGPAHIASKAIAYRPHLDYEAEVGILMQKDRKERFGYVMVNDLTDRGVQVRTYDKDSPAEGFSEAKSFEEALRVGPLLVIGNEAAWEDLDIVLRVNGKRRQQVKARECLLKPSQFHEQVFEGNTDNEWLLVSTGTSEGVVFKTPSAAQKAWLFLKGGLSVRGAERELLESMVFLQPDDKVEMKSTMLGVCTTHVVSN
jgi:2-keto-4-pentenoate hydratase/2-oxohepta-3-ene-1,7-dioic acid hydratase in catechol pathway